MRLLKNYLAIIVSVSVFASIMSSAYSCTRILNATKDHAVMVGRTMDWYGEMYTNLYVYPRGIHHTDGSDKNPMQWTSKYGSIAAAAYDAFTSDGFNEKGLGAHILWLNGSDYGQRDLSKSGLSVALWAQYYLDNFATVNEAVNFTHSNSFQILPFYLKPKEKWVALHLALEDATGDSAIVEYIDGVVHVYHDKNYIAVTNDPTYDKQLANLAQYSGFGGDKTLPGTDSPEDRLVRAAYYEKRLPATTSDAEQLTFFTSIVRNVTHPYQAPTDAKPYVGGTIWSSICDLTHKKYYFNLSTRFNTIITDLNQFDLRAGSPVMRLDVVNREDLNGDVSKEFKAVSSTSPTK